jgi:hypothetical protein
VGVGDVTFGMTREDAEAAVGGAFEDQGPGTPACTVASVAGQTGRTYVVVNGRVERIDVTSEQVATRSGARIGTTEEQLRSLFGDQLDEEDRTDGRAGSLLVFVPRDATDAQFRIVFETDGSRVTGMRAGRLPYVLAPVPCG